MIETELLKRIDTLISVLSAPKVPAGKELWNKKQVAAYLGLSASHFSQRIACKPTFPKPIKINEGERDSLRWYAQDIWKWLEARKIA